MNNQLLVQKFILVKPLGPKYYYFNLAQVSATDDINLQLGYNDIV